MEDLEQETERWKDEEVKKHEKESNEHRCVEPVMNHMKIQWFITYAQNMYMKGLYQLYKCHFHIHIDLNSGVKHGNTLVRYASMCQSCSSVSACVCAVIAHRCLSVTREESLRLRLRIQTLEEKDRERLAPAPEDPAPASPETHETRARVGTGPEDPEGPEGKRRTASGRGNAEERRRRRAETRLKKERDKAARTIQKGWREHRDKVCEERREHCSYETSGVAVVLQYIVSYWIFCTSLHTSSSSSCM